MSRLAPFALLAVLLAAWEIAVRAMHVPAYFLPAPSAVAVALAENLPTLVAASWRTLSTALVALVLASLIAQALAIVTALSPLADRAIRPLASVVQVTPVVAIAPLVLIWAGIDHPERALVTLAVLVAFFPIFSGAAAGLRSADPDLERLFALYGAGRWQRVVRLRLPSAVPFLLEGHKVGAGLALIGAVVAEFGAGSGGVRGLAWQILDAGNKLQTARMIAALMVLGAMGVALHALLEAVERAGLKWWRGR
ncbi:MAG: ABC transporter permease [Alphaproteobacteria bacterium]|nr:ABC transporter permease [Alphaproteobacteria bacterium]MBU1512794.1 ABC transporter permease [Alphaproteobacteria bacterium]MBU2093970.1 ABC transporter permease [Alphaproteobacteria bacterium]MBU2150002.1 ABC transporter permease [Alphaproteobacteria bacterium]MBU2306457.1 ABC transporter permease [Alphaproteobacteria bacterium]